MGNCANSTADVDIELVEEMEAPINVFGSKFVVPPGKPAILHMKCKFWSFSDGSFTIKDISNGKENGIPLFSCKGKFFSLSDKRMLFEADGETPVFCMKEEFFQCDDQQAVHRVTGKGEDAKAGDFLFKISSNCCNTKQCTAGLEDAGLDAELYGQMSVIDMKGGMWYGDPSNEEAIAKICSPVQLKNFMPEMGGMQFGGDDYFIEIAPGVDMALVVAMALAYEEMEQSYDDDI